MDEADSTLIEGAHEKDTSFDSQQQIIIPNSGPGYFEAIKNREMSFHFTARYRSVSESVKPGKLHSDVWFTLVYP